MKRSGPIKRTQRKTAVFRCGDCGTQFQRRSDHRPRAADGVYRCTKCSNTHRVAGREYPSRRTGEERSCETCGKTFYRSAWHLEQGGRFCSRPCADEWRKDAPVKGFLAKSSNNAGKRNGRYVHGRRVEANRNKVEVRKAVARRDGDWCLFCGRPPGGLHLHRVIYGAQGGPYAEANCVQLCFTHHDLVHSNKRRWQPALLDHLTDDHAPLDALLLKEGLGRRSPR